MESCPIKISKILYSVLLLYSSYKLSGTIVSLFEDNKEHITYILRLKPEYSCNLSL